MCHNRYTGNTDQSLVHVIKCNFEEPFYEFLIKVFTLKCLFLVSIKSTQSNEICLTENWQSQATHCGGSFFFKRKQWAINKWTIFIKQWSFDKADEVKYKLQLQ